MKSKKSVIFTVIVRLILAIILTVAVVFLIKSFLSSLEDMEHYQRVHENPLIVTAKVTKHDSYTDSEGDTDYYSYVTYVAEGTRYKNRRYETKNSKNDLTPVGTEFTLKVSPEDPSQQISRLYSSGTAFGVTLFFLILLLSIGWSLLISEFRSRALYCTPQHETIQKDLKLTVYRRGTLPFFFLFAIGCAVANYRYPMVLDSWCGIAAIISGIIWLVCLNHAIRDMRIINREEYEQRFSTLIAKEIDDSDSESTTYRLIYQSGTKVWKTTTSQEKYNQVHVGEKVLSVFFPKNKDPFMHYDATGTAK